jgi:putative ABC transport system substrate-binding protein
MKRREFITLLGGAAAAWPLAAHGQQTERVRRIGVLSGLADDTEGRFRVTTFQQKLRELGWTEGHNIHIERRWAAGDVDRMHTYAAELVAMKPDAILAITTAALVPLRKATSSIPIVFVNVGDPAESGFVESLARPGGNITGITTFVSSIGGKWLELLKEVVPRVVRVLVILNRDNPTAHGLLRIIEASAPSFGIKVTQVSVHTGNEIEIGIENFARQPDIALLVLPDPATVVNRERIVALAAQHRIPAVYPFGYFVDSGGLMSYGTVPADQYRQAALYVDRILKGANPAELPVQQPAKFELVVNLKTAKALGLTIPESFLLRAPDIQDGGKRRGCNETSPPKKLFASGRGRCRAAVRVTDCTGASLSVAAGAHPRRLCGRRLIRHPRAPARTVAVRATWPAICH